MVFIFFSVNCLDCHVARDPSAVAIIWEKNEPGEQEEITYKYVWQILFLFCDISLNVDGFYLPKNECCFA